MKIREETINSIFEFSKKRNWSQFHNPKDLAISISLEAAELLEVFQWSGQDLNCQEKSEKIKEELSDVVIYSLLMAQRCGIDIDKSITEKINLNKEKYPVDKSFGSSKKYTEI